MSCLGIALTSMSCAVRCQEGDRFGDLEVTLKFREIYLKQSSREVVEKGKKKHGYEDRWGLYEDGWGSV